MIDMLCRGFRVRLFVSGVMAGCSLAAVARADVTPPDDKLETITVTARKTKENLQDTPVSVSAFSGDRLEAQGISQVNRIQDFTPNLTFGNVPSNSGVASNAAVYIRGIGQNDFAPGVDPGVGIYVDGVYMGRSVGGVFDMIDVANVEVLRGPQGTLFGRNTIGGAINITSMQPGDTWTGKMDVKYGTDNRINGRAVVSGPLSDTLSFKLGGGIFSQDGYVSAPNQSTGKLGNQDTKTVKGALRWRPTSKLDITLAADWLKDKSHGVPVTVTGANPGVGLAALANLDSANIYSTNTFYGTGKTFSDIAAMSATLTMAYNLSSAVQIKSISALRRTRGAFSQDRDSSPLDINYVYDQYRQDQFTQELQLTGKLASNLSYIGGLYYFQEKGADINPVQFYVLSEMSGGYFSYNSWAAYGQATWKPVPKLDLTAGLRYTQDNKAYTPDQYYTAGTIYAAVTYGMRIVPYATYHNNSRKATPMANIAYHWTHDLMTYATVSQGFKGGGFTQRLQEVVQTLPTFRPETVTSYEAGVKYTALGNRLRLNGDVYWMDYKDMQLLVADASSLGPHYENAGKSRIKGFELEAAFAPGGGWRFNAAAGLTDAHFVQLDSSVSGITYDTPFALVSKWTLSGSVEKTFELGGQGKVVPRLDVAYRSGYNTNANTTFVPQLWQPAYALLNGSLRWEKGHYSAVAGVDNITNKRFRTFGDYQPSFGFYQQSFDRGRQWYVKLGYAF
jgi:iron complex outermembrane receptor protein